MFIEHLTEKDFLAQEERNVLFGYQMVSLLRSEGVRLFVVFYKHLVPLEPKTPPPKIQSGLLREQDTSSLGKRESI
jgi:hypothetical protein